jgi:hypothetical protein
MENLRNKKIDSTNLIIEKTLPLLLPIVSNYKSLLGCSDDEPLDGGEVEGLVIIVRAIINLQEGNITQEEYRGELYSNKILF